MKIRKAQLSWVCVCQKIKWVEKSRSTAPRRLLRQEPTCDDFSFISQNWVETFQRKHEIWVASRKDTVVQDWGWKIKLRYNFRLLFTFNPYVFSWRGLIFLRYAHDLEYLWGSKSTIFFEDEMNKSAKDKQSSLWEINYSQTLLVAFFGEKESSSIILAFSWLATLGGRKFGQTNKKCR